MSNNGKDTDENKIQRHERERIEAEELLERERIEAEELLERERIEMENICRQSLLTAEQTIKNATLKAESQIRSAFEHATSILNANTNDVKAKSKFTKYIENIANTAIDELRKSSELEINKLRNIRDADAEFLNRLASSTANRLKQEAMLKAESLAKLKQSELKSLREQSKDPSFNALDYARKICEIRKKNAIIESDKLKHAALYRHNLLRDNTDRLCDKLKSDANLSVTNIMLTTNNHINEINHQLELFQAERIHKIKQSHTKYLIIVIMVVIFSTSMLYLNTQINLKDDSRDFSTNYLIQNLRGDNVDTWVSWKKPAGATLFINVQKSKYATQERLSAISDAITSQKQIEIDDSLVHKGPRGMTSVYYVGWSGALNSITEDTKFSIPKNLQIGTYSDTFVGDIEIILTDLANPDAYSAFTKSIIDEENHQILKSTITIYDVNKINSEDLRTLIRHEFGHALGLGHSTAPEDLMYPVISTNYPYISDCDISAIVALYDGAQQSQVVCEK